MSRRQRNAGLLIAAAIFAAGLLILLFIRVDRVQATDPIVYGDATTYGDGYTGLLALPTGRGHLVRICSSHSGERRCVTGVSNDKGPTKRGRVADLDVPTFEWLCGCPGNWRQVGVLHEVSVEYLPSQASTSPTPTPTGSNRPTRTLPPTDTN